MYYKSLEDDFILGVGIGKGGTEINQTEYRAIMTAIQNRPIPPEGYRYRLRNDLTWELHEALPIPEVEKEAEETDYLAALDKLGVRADD